MAKFPAAESSEAGVYKAGGGYDGRARERARVPGYFLSGEPHAVVLVDEYGIAITDSARLARDVLVWDEDGGTVRLEGDLTKTDAVEIAEALR